MAHEETEDWMIGYLDEDGRTNEICIEASSHYDAKRKALCHRGIATVLWTQTKVGFMRDNPQIFPKKT